MLRAARVPPRGAAVSLLEVLLGRDELSALGCSAAATELRRSRRLAAATESLRRRSCADQLRRAHSARRTGVQHSFSPVLI